MGSWARYIPCRGACWHPRGLSLRPVGSWSPIETAPKNVPVLVFDGHAISVAERCLGRWYALVGDKTGAAGGSLDGGRRAHLLDAASKPAGGFRPALTSQGRKRSTARGLSALARHHDLGADVHAPEQVGDILVEHANAAIRGELADRLRPVGAVDGYSPPNRVMAATPIGLLGAPPGITSGRAGLSALTSAGGVQAGCTYLPFT